MTTLTETRTGTLPRVNLLPPEIEQERRLRRIQAGLGVLVLGTAAVVGALFFLANAEVNQAQEELDASQARTTTLQARANKFAEVTVVAAQVEAAEAQLSQAMGQEVRWSYFLNDLSLVTPSKVWLTEVTVAQTVDAAAAATAAAATPSGEPSFVEAGIGTVTVFGKGLRHNDVAAWLDALAKQNGLAQPYLTSSTLEAISGEKVASFESQATITEDALSRRFQKADS